MRDWNAMHDFLLRTHRADYYLCLRSFFWWLFGNESTDEANVITAWDGERIVGMIGCLPGPTFWGDPYATIHASWITDLFVEPGYRYGVGLALLYAVRDLFPIILGSPITQENERIVTQLGWTVYPRLARYLAVFDQARAARILMPEARREELEAVIVRSISTAGDARRLRLPGDYDPDWILYRSLLFGTVRSATFLQWRYFDHPVLRYTVLTAGGPRRPAVCAYRLERALDDADVLVGRIVDLFHPDDAQGYADGISVVGAVMTQLRAEGCVYADAVVSWRPAAKTLRAAGWGEEPQDHMLLPMRLQPIERRPYANNIEIYAAKGLAIPALDELYVTRADACADVPQSVSDELIRRP